MMTIAIGSDHAGYDYKERIKNYLQDRGYQIMDFGTKSSDSVDYPDFAHPVSQAIDDKEFNLGILVCGSGNGVAMTANKYTRVRAAICWNEDLATLARQHNNANILCIPSRFISYVLTEKIVTTFLTEQFEGGRHQNRIDKIGC